MSVYRTLSNSPFISACDTPLYVVLSCWQTHKPQHTKGMIRTAVRSSFRKPATPDGATHSQQLWCSVTWALWDVASKCVGVGVVSAWERTPSSFLLDSLYYSFKLVCRHVVFQRTDLSVRFKINLHPHCNVSLVLRVAIIDTGVTERITERSVCCQGATLSKPTWILRWVYVRGGFSSEFSEFPSKGKAVPL
jgi:hypothetical protein